MDENMIPRIASGFRGRSSLNTPLTTEQQIQAVLSALAEVQACDNCGARFRFGDLDCPHCGAELDDYFRGWAVRLLEKLGIYPGGPGV